jgi:hypothetical protein
MPLILSFNFNRLVSPHSKQKLLLALQHRDRVCAISVKNWCFGGLELRSALDNTFPMLESLSLYDNNYEVLPDNIVAPRLRALHLLKIAISRRSLLLTNATNLLSLRLKFMPERSNYLSPEYLVEHLASMPHLENISIEFFPSSPRSETVGELPYPQITRVELPSLSRLIYKGTSPYLNNLLSRISTPFLQYISLRTETPDVVRLSAFLRTVQNEKLDFRATVITFYPRTVHVVYYPERPSVSLPYLSISINYSSQECAVTSVAQICNAVAPALFSVVESLEIQVTTDYKMYGLDSGLFAQRARWHAFLRLFGSVKMLMVDKALAEELSDALHPNNGAVVKELLPILSELTVTIFRNDVVHNYFSSFIRARHLSGHSIDLGFIRGRHDFFRKPCISWSFDTFSDCSGMMRN